MKSGSIRGRLTLLRQERAPEVGLEYLLEACWLARLFYCRRGLLISRGSSLTPTEVHSPWVSLPYAAEPLCSRRTCFAPCPLHCIRFAQAATEPEAWAAVVENGRAAGRTEADRLESSSLRHRRTTVSCRSHSCTCYSNSRCLGAAPSSGQEWRGRCQSLSEIYESKMASCCSAKDERHC